MSLIYLTLDPRLMVISPGQSIVFVNVDGLDHQLIIESSDDERQIFDTGVLKQNASVSHTFSKAGTFNIQDSKYDRIKGEIRVTDDILSLTKKDG